jgi:hypothetical protein
MAISEPVEIRSYIKEIVAPCSLTQNWTTAISAGGPAVQDNASITNPTTQITAATRIPLRRGGVGTILLLRLGYDDALTTITDPVVKVFGRTGSDAWQLLKSIASALTATLPTAATDSTDGTLDYTTPDLSTHAWDCAGCDELLVGVETALAGTGSTANAIIQAKVI